MLMQHARNRLSNPHQTSGLAFRHPQRLRRPAPAAPMATAHPQSAVGSGSSSRSAADGGDQPAAAAAGQATGAPLSKRNSGTFRFWHDERRFKGPIDRCLVQDALFAAGGVRTGGYPKTAPISGPLGWQRSSDWDLLWSPARTALRAACSLKPGQLVSAVPGLYSLTKKRRLSTTLAAAYGADAWDLMPHSYSLPQQLPEWQAWLQEQVAAGRDPGPWMLKTAQHLGKGLVLLPGHAAFQAAQQPRLPGAKPFVLAQRYIADPLLINGCKFGVRLWLLVTGVDPLTAYLHNQGLVLFSTDSYDPESLSDDEGAASRGHITNYAQNVNGTVWNLAMLKQHLGADAYRVLWGKLVSSAALVVCAALGDMRRQHAKLGFPPHATFELLGLDYLVDTSMHPHLLEVNGTPSLAVAHAEPSVEQLIRDAKGSMVRDMVEILQVRSRFLARYGLHKSGARMSAAQAERAQALLGRSSDTLAKLQVDGELQHRGGFLPLMAHFPVRQFAATAPAAAAAADPAAAQPAYGEGASPDGSGPPQRDADGALHAGALDATDVAGLAGAGAATEGIQFSDSDKRLYVYMLQWWQQHRAASPKRRLASTGRKRLKRGDAPPASPPAASAAAVAGTADV